MAGDGNAERRAGAIDGLNLFFGALLGANLGTLGVLKLSHYLAVISLIAAVIMALRMLPVAGRRRHGLRLIGMYGVLLCCALTFPDLAPKELPRSDMHKLIGTLTIWIALALAIEFAPARPPREEGPQP